MICPFELEGYKTPDIKKEFRKTLEASGYVIKESTKDGNQVHIFGVRIVGEGE